MFRHLRPNPSALAIIAAILRIFLDPLAEAQRMIREVVDRVRGHGMDFHALASEPPSHRRRGRRLGPMKIAPTGSKRLVRRRPKSIPRSRAAADPGNVDNAFKYHGE